MRERRPSNRKFSLPRKAWCFAAVVALTGLVAGCSNGGKAKDSEEDALCGGVISPASERALEKMAGESSLSSTVPSDSESGRDLKKESQGWKSDPDPDISNSRWTCSVDPGGDRDKRIVLFASWSKLQTESILKLIEKGSDKYIKVSPEVFIVPRGKEFANDSTVYFSCELQAEGSGAAPRTLTAGVTDTVRSKGTQADANQITLSLARWMADEVDCVNAADLPSSA
jgi:hypothetical protein